MYAGRKWPCIHHLISTNSITTAPSAARITAKKKACNLRACAVTV
jgi:hypothetical protein